jgi:hypothetical protein
VDVESSATERTPGAALEALHADWPRVALRHAPEATGPLWESARLGPGDEVDAA